MTDHLRESDQMKDGGQSSLPAPPITPAVSANQFDEILQELRNLRNLAETSFPRPETGLLHKIQARIQLFVRYVGVPAVIIATVLPVYELGNQLIEYRNSQYITSTYVSYANELFEDKEFDRAKTVLSAIGELKHLDSQTQYARARVLLEAAFRKGRSYIEAEDTTKILLLLHKHAPLLFPGIGGDREVRNLELRLVDILTQRTAYDKALKQLDSLGLGSDKTRQSEEPPDAAVRRGRILVLQHQYKPARELLQGVLVDFQIGRAHV